MGQKHGCIGSGMEVVQETGMLSNLLRLCACYECCSLLSLLPSNYSHQVSGSGKESVWPNLTVWFIDLKRVHTTEVTPPKNVYCKKGK